MTKKVDHPFKQANMPFMMKVFLNAMTLLFKLLGTLSPRLGGKLGGKIALDLFMKPPNPPAPKREKAIREKADLSYRNLNGKNTAKRNMAVRVWENKNSDQSSYQKKGTILLSHGWAGRTAQFLEIIEPLVNAGYRVVGADMPAHGDSAGTHTNMLDASQTLSIIGKEFGPLDAIIGHSFGTGTALLAMDKFGLESPKIILIGAYSRVSFIIKLFAEVFHLNQAIQDAMLQEATNKFAEAYDIEWDWKNIAPVNTIKSYQGQVFFIHDKDDHEVPMKEVTELHQTKANAKLLITNGLGHRRILRDKTVAEEVLAFIQNN